MSVDLRFTVDQLTAGFLSDLANKKKLSLDDFTKEIFLEALELQEDKQDLLYLEKHDTPDARHISHEEAWK